MRCRSCGAYEFVNGRCNFCGWAADTLEPTKGAMSGEVDIFEMAKLLEHRKEEERRSKIPRLSDCPKCHIHSLFYNTVADQFECLRPECKYTVFTKL